MNAEKTKEDNMSNLTMKFLLALALVFVGKGSGLAYGQFDNEEFDFEEDPIVVRGSMAERTRKQMERIRRRHNEKVENAIENMRLKEEERIGKKLDNMFKTGSLNNSSSDRVSVAQSAPAPRSVSRRSSWFAGESSSFTLSAGIRNIQASNGRLLGENGYTGTGSLGMEFARTFYPRVDAGLSVSYTAMRFKDDNLLYHGGGYWHGSSSDWGPQIDGDIASLEFVGRFYLTRDGLFRPFMTAAAGINYLSLRYTGQDYGNYSSHGYGYGYGYGYNRYGQDINTGEGEGSLYGNTKLGLGVSFSFSRDFGLIAQGSFSKNFNTAGRDNRYHYNGYSRYHGYGRSHRDYRSEILKDLSDQIANGSQYDLTFGVMALF